MMTLISCVSDCVYQRNGYCTLGQAASNGIPSDDGCIHYVPKQHGKYKTAKKKKEGDSTSIKL